MPEVHNEKVLSFVLSITLLVSASAWAGVAESSNAAAHTTAIPLPSLTPKVTDEDMAQLFEVDGKPQQLAKLSTLEMKETEGAWWDIAVAIVVKVAATHWESKAKKGSETDAASVPLPS